MKLDSSPSSLHQNYTCAKFLVCILFVGVSIRLLLFSSWVTCPFADQAAKHSDNDKSSPFSNASGETQKDVLSQATQREKCNIFDGEWVPHPAGPAYTNLSCRTIFPRENCMRNGRPDSNYLYWRWKPKGCDMPLFDAQIFLNAMRNKWWAFIGDSISFNHIQSLICLLSQVEEPIMVFHDEEWRWRRWHVPSFNFTLSVIWSPFLVQSESSKDNNEIQLHLDVLHTKWISQLKKFDYVIISGGQWFLRRTIYYENNKIVGCHYCPGKNLTELGYRYGYSKALSHVLHYIASSDFKGTFLLRTSAPDHFENGDWNTGGTCPRTRPFKEGEVRGKEVVNVMRKVEMEVFEQVETQARRNGVDLRLLDVTYMSLLRPDGHPGPYRSYPPISEAEKAHAQNDCLHWCMPGPIDFWNHLLMDMFVNQANWL